MTQRNDRPRCKRLLRELQLLDFSIYDTVLYLDAYPESKEALDYYRTLIQERQSLAQQYEENCGPLTIGGVRNTAYWDWTKLPWPWELDANL